MVPLVLVLAMAARPAVQGTAVDVSALSFGPPVLVVEVDASRLKGDLRRLAWKPDGTTLYVQTAQGRPPDETARHYAIDIAGGALAGLDSEPDWAAAYWAVKQDRVAPGIPALVIEIQQGIEALKSGPGASGVLDRQSSPDAVAGGSPNVENLANGMHGNQNADVVRLRLAGQDIAVWVNERPFPGMKFSWGPSGSGALVFTGEHGELIFLDGRRRRQDVPKVKGAFLPAWSADGGRVAYVQKTGRKKLAFSWIAVGK
jgi:hypothetical protein